MIFSLFFKLQISIANLAVYAAQKLKSGSFAQLIPLRFNILVTPFFFNKTQDSVDYLHLICNGFLIIFIAKIGFQNTRHNLSQIIR